MMSIDRVDKSIGVRLFAQENALTQNCNFS